MSLNVAEFRERYPAFADSVRFTNSYVDAMLLMALRQTSVKFGARFDDAQGLLTAHLISMMPPFGVAGRLPVEVQDGDGRVRYSELTNLRNPLAATGYGQMLLRLIKLSFGGPRQAWEPIPVTAVSAEIEDDEDTGEGDVQSVRVTQSTPSPFAVVFADIGLDDPENLNYSVFLGGESDGAVLESSRTLTGFTIVDGALSDVYDILVIEQE